MSMITGEENIKWYHMRALLSALKLEVAGLGNSRGSAYAHIKRSYGLRGNKKNVYAQFQKMVEDARPIDLAGSYDLCREQLSRI